MWHIDNVKNEINLFIWENIWGLRTGPELLSHHDQESRGKMYE
jgi:hypothetical protein